MHVLLKFSLLLALASVLSHVSRHGLLIVAALTVMLASIVNAQALWVMLRRVKWLMLMLLLIYAFTTPGQYITHDVPGFIPHALLPSYEGMAAGIQQALTIVTMLAGLSLLMSSTSSSGLMAGLYQCLLPLRHLGFAPDTFAARLWLTLHYVESNQALRAQGRIMNMMQAFSLVDQWHVGNQHVDEQALVERQPVTIQLIPLTALDKLGLCAIFLAITTLWIV